MLRAIECATSGMGQTWPNPSVGCVIVADDMVVSEACTAQGGRPHAETSALARATRPVEGATAYVSLEPCAHHGVTPPCAEALIAANIGAVVIGCVDEDPRVAGRGAAMLRAAGITVREGVASSEAGQTLLPFFHRLRTGRPYACALVDAQSEDARYYDAIARVAPGVTSLQGLQSHGRLRLEVPPDVRPAELLSRLGEHGLTSVAVAHGDPLAEALARDGLLSRPLDLKDSTGSTGSGGARAR